MMIVKSMIENKKINRKTFLRIATLSMVAAFVVLWRLMTGKQKQLENNPETKRINVAKLGTGIHWFDNFILIKSAKTLKVFSNKCTHAGCRINQEINGQLVCPCHGSRYDSESGKVLQGPAGLPLSTLPFTTDAKTGEITIKI